MIVTCEQCQTRFKLDGARIPEGGARVRCSRCKHAFFVVRPGATARAAAVHALAGEAAVAGGAPPPTPTTDLGTFDGELASADTSATRLMPPIAAAASAPSCDPLPVPDTESDWQFNEPLRAGASAEPIRAPRRPAARLAPLAPAEGAASLDALGSPESWDILGDASLPPLDGAPVGASAKGPEPPARAADPLRAGRAAQGVAEAEVEPPSSSARAGARVVPRDVALMAGVWLWIAAVAAVSLVPRAPAARSSALGPTPRGVATESLRGRFLDNAVAGPLFVVSGELRGSGDAAPPGALVVVAVGPSGDVGRAPLGDAPPDVQLRERAPDALAREIADSSFARGTRTLAAGERLRVAALLPGAPRDVTGFRVEEARASSPPARASDRGGAPAPES